MKRENWKVKEYGIRPAGSPDHCFYCNAARGEIHALGCTIRSKTVVMEMKVEIVMVVPEIWDEQTCNFHKNESSWCATNILDILQVMDEKQGCLCGATEFKYLREATEEDEQRQGVFISEVPS